MLRLILLAVVLLVALTGGVAALLFHYLGWVGLLIFPFVLLFFVWVGFKIIGRLLKRVPDMLFGMKAKVLHKAGLEVHGITPVSVARRITAGELEAEGEKDAEAEAEEMKHYYDVDMTITPQSDMNERHWEPGEFMLISKPASKLTDLEGLEVGNVHGARIWNGTEFGEDEGGKYPGPQRLKVTFAVKPGSARSWLQYYNETIGEINLPAWKVDGLNNVT